MMIYFIAIILLLLAALGAPLFAVILAVALIGFYALGIDLSVIAIEIYRIADAPLLLALPFFTFAGYLMGKSNTSERLVRLTRVFLNWMPGGLALVALVTCALFTAFTGASGVTIVALGALLYPALIQDGYRQKFSLGLVTTSGSLGLLFPPSLPLILYGVIAQQMSTIRSFSIDDLFLAGLLPGLLMVVMLSSWSLWTNREKPKLTTRFSAREALVVLREAAWEIPLPLFLIAGIYGGFLAILDIFSALVIMVPLILPVAISYGIDPIHLGIIFLANMQIGYFTPPVGMNLFIASYRFEKPVAEIYKATIPFMIVLLLAVILITYWPALSMVLLR
jgi:TRAP-type C4-dicarboxylate transport system permease large subunit